MKRAWSTGGVAALLLLAGCSSTPEPRPDVPAPADARAGSTADATVPTVSDRVEPDLSLARSTPVEDSVYPAVGGPDVDALLSDLDLA